jgi:hypothetical protein
VGADAGLVQEIRRAELAERTEDIKKGAQLIGCAPFFLTAYPK